MPSVNKQWERDMVDSRKEMDGSKSILREGGYTLGGRKTGICGSYTIAGWPVSRVKL